MSMRKRKRVNKYYSITKEELILALQNKQVEKPEIPQPQQANGKTPFFKKQTTTTKTIITKQEETCVGTSNDAQENIPVQGEEAKEEAEDVVKSTMYR